jgi:alkanesulfonate monooxygenase SsuD/methylene tetrahydromethanopterin reductase-like flavin-dependent oxidoreductase (luciferase family)
MENHGALRHALQSAAGACCHKLWLKGCIPRFVHFDQSGSAKPKQKPHPPIFLGGETDHTLKRVVEFCDGWFPRARGGWEPKSGAARLRQAADAAKRDPASLSITVFGAPSDQAALAAYREAGIDRVLLEVPDLNRDETCACLTR